MVDKGQVVSFSEGRERLLARLREPAPARIQLLAGPRQVGKTTLLHAIESALGPSALYAAGDDPSALEPGFWERTWDEAESRARRRRKTVLLLDEIHHFPDWAARLKGRFDRAGRAKLPLHVVATGSSTLAVGSGTRESLAGRFERLVLTHWSAASLATEFDLRAEDAVRESVRFGAYPGARPLLGDFARWRAYVRDSIIEPAIGRDILSLHAVRRPALLRQVFGIAASSPATIVSLQKMQGQLSEKGALETVSHYLALLEEAFLVASLSKHSDKAHRRRASPPKLVPLSQAFLSAAHPDGPPDPKKDSARFGVWVENACLAHAWNSGQSVSYWREEPLEADAVIEGSWGAFALEVKTGSVRASDLRAALEFCRRNPKFRPLLVADPGAADTLSIPGVTVTSWPAFLEKK